MKTKIYLAGAIGCYGENNEYPREWRKQACEWFEIYSSYAYGYDFLCINPMDYYEYGKDYHKTEREVMLFDLRKLLSCDLVLVNLTDIEKSPGTIGEIMYAWIKNIPIVGFMESDEVINNDNIVKNGLLHPWIYEQIDRIETGTNAQKKAMGYIKDYYGKK